MKKVSTYLPSLIISVLLVFGLIGTSAMVLVDINISADKLKKLAEKNGVETSIYNGLSKYYKDKYNTTGIPAEVFMDSVDEAWLRQYEEAYIDSAFEALGSDGVLTVSHPENNALNDSIDKFFNDFADENNYQKDENFYEKLDNTKANAFTAIGSYCDVYKFTSMSEHGILPKLARVYSNRGLATAVLAGAAAVLFMLLLFINRKKKITVMYWLGVSSLIAGILGAVPSIYLLATRYFDSFTVKQEAVFKAFTGVMYKYTEAFAAVNIALGVIGIALLVVYGVVHEKKKYPDVKPTKID